MKDLRDTETKTSVSLKMKYREAKIEYITQDSVSERITIIFRECNIQYYKARNAELTAKMFKTNTLTEQLALWQLRKWITTKSTQWQLFQINCN